MPSQLRPYVIPIFIPHAGCPHRCIFCDQRQITGRNALPSPAEVRQAIRSFLDHCAANRGRTEISFFGGNFLGLPPNRVRDYLREAAVFVTENQVHGLRFSTRPDTITPRSLRLIEAFPVTTVELGVQSMNDRVLAAANRGHTTEDTRLAVNLLTQAGYKIGLQMMTGLPGDTCESALMTARELIALNADFIRIYPTLVLRGSTLAVQYRQGRYRPMPLEASVDLVAQLYALFACAGIPVVRMGLQASESLETGGAVIAGPYHPAFGHLVFSRLFLNAANQVLTAMPAENRPETIHVHPSEISRMQGLNHQNLRILSEAFHLPGLCAVSDPTLDKGHIRIARHVRAVGGVDIG